MEGEKCCRKTVVQDFVVLFAYNQCGGVGKSFLGWNWNRFEGASRILLGSRGTATLPVLIV